MAIRQPAESSAGFVEVEGELLDFDYRGHSAQVLDSDGKVTKFSPRKTRRAPSMRSGASE